MPIEIYDAPLLGNRFLDHAGIEDNGIFTYPADEEITSGDLLNLVDYHREHMRRHYLKQREYYKGDHFKITHARDKAPWKPDNRLILNFPRKAVTTFNGFFIGNPIKVDNEKDKHADQFVADWARQNDFDAVASEVSKMASMYGHAYFLVFQSEVPAGSDELAAPRLVPVDPMNAFIIYDDGFEQRPRYAVLYRRNYEHETEVTLIDASYRREMVVDRQSGDYMRQARVTANPYKMVPLIEVDENAERMALCEDVITLIDALDKAVSDKANDNDYFADAMLKIVNANIDPKKMKDMHDNRVMNLTGLNAKEAQVDYLAKPDSDQTQEHLIDRLVRSIYEIANITNLNDDAFNGNPSGVSLKLKYQAMDNMARAKTLQFKAALRQVFHCVFATSFYKVAPDAWETLDFKFTRSIPVNLLEESQVVANMYGKISNRTLFGALSIVDDPDAELKQIKKEQQDAQQATAGAVQQALAAAQTDQQKAGVDSDHPEAGAAKNPPAHQAGQQDKPTA